MECSKIKFPRPTGLFRRAIALILGVVCTLQLLGWVIGNRWMMGFFGGMIPMHPITVSIFEVAAVSLWFGDHKIGWKRWVCLCSAGLICVAGIANLATHRSDVLIPFDLFFFPKLAAQVAAVIAPMPFRMSGKTSTCFVIMGVAQMITLSRPRFRIVAFLLSLAVALLSVETITGYLFLDAASQYRETVSSPMAIGSAFFFLLLAMAVGHESTSWPCMKSGKQRPRQSQQSLIMAGFAATVLALSGVGLFSHQSVKQFIIDAHWDHDTFDATEAISQLSLGLQSADRAERGYIITGDPLFLKARLTALDNIRLSLQSLRSLTRDHASQKQRIDQVESLVAQKLTRVDELVQLRRDKGFESAQKSMMNGPRRGLMTQIIALLDQMRYEESNVLSQRLLATETNAHRGMLMMGVAVVIALVLISLAAWMLYRDSDSRARAAEALEASDTLYRSVLESAPVAIVIVDLLGTIDLVNARAEQMFGYTSAEMCGRPVGLLLPQKDQRENIDYFINPTTHYAEHTREFQGIRKDGAEFSMEINLSQMQTIKGPRMSSAIVDVTVRRRHELEMANLTKTLLERTVQLGEADQELRETVERFRSLVESAKEYAIFMLSPDGIIKTWNSGAERIKGYTATQAIGRHFSCFYSDEDCELHKPEEELAMAARDGQYEEDGWRIRSNGTRFRANVVITAIKNEAGHVTGFSKITRDLTERIRAQEQASNFFMLSLDLLCIIGHDGYFKRLNASWESTLGYTNAELMSARFLDFIHPDDHERTTAATDTLAKGGTNSPFENRYRCKDGSYRWLLWKSAFSSDSELIYAAATDITDRKKVEEEIGDLNQTLQRQNLRLETANQELESFSYSVSHDLRTPLRSIDGFSQAVLEDYGDKLDEVGRTHLMRVRAASQRMGQLIDDLLNLSRVSRGELLYETTNMSQIARDIAEECRASSTDREVEVIIADGLVTQADPRLMRIALTNFIGNAWKFTGKTTKASIEFGCVGTSGTAEYFVRDNGAGFDMTYANKLFGPFQRLHSDKEFPGTGIGLATIQRIIHRHGGRVRAESKPDEGATFFFTLEQQNGLVTQTSQPLLAA